jgi:hypothetical protein
MYGEPTAASALQQGATMNSGCAVAGKRICKRWGDAGLLQSGINHQGGNMAKASIDATKSEVEIKLPTEQDHEVDYFMRATGRSRVQVLNAIKVRGPSREAVLRALAR